MQERFGSQSEQPNHAASGQEVQVTIIDDEGRQVQLEGAKDKGRPGRLSDESLTRSVAELGAYMSLTAAKVAGALLGAVGRRLAQTGPARIASQVTSDTLAVIREEVGVDWSQAARVAEERLARIVAVVVPVVVQSVDPDELVTRLDLEALLDEIDVNALLSRVDLNRLLEAVDVNRLVSSVDVESILDRLDLNDVLSRIDINALLDGVDVDAVAQRLRVGDMVVEGTGRIAESAIDLARRQGAGLDVLVAHAVNRVLGRDSDAMPPGPPALTAVGWEPPL